METVGKRNVPVIKHSSYASNFFTFWTFDEVQRSWTCILVMVVSENFVYMFGYHYLPLNSHKEERFFSAI